MTCLAQGETSGTLMQYEDPPGGQLMLGLQTLPLALQSLIKGSPDPGIGHTLEHKTENDPGCTALTFQWRDR